MVRRTTLALSALAAAGVLVGGQATVFADEGDSGRPGVVAPEGVMAGDAGPLAAHTQKFGDWVSMPAGLNRAATVTCPSGQVPTGGGGSTIGTHTFLTDSYGTANGWTVIATNTGTGPESLRAFVICTTP